jgi:hypothetical protein
VPDADDFLLGIRVKAEREKNQDRERAQHG